MRDAENNCGFAVRGEARSEKELTALSYERFVRVFEGLCGSKQDKVVLQDIYERMTDRWGYHGVDMVSSFPEKYINLDFNRLQKAAEAFIHSASQDLQAAAEEFWWLMGMGKDSDILADTGRFEELCARMSGEGLEKCKVVAAKIREKIQSVA